MGFALIKDIAGYEGKYCVDIYGNVYSYLSRGCRNKRLKIPKELKQFQDYRGYKYINFGTKPGRRFCVHRLVMQTFSPSKDSSCTQVDHINNIKWDNRLSNLQWLTPKENSNRKHIHGTMLQGEVHPKAVLNPEKVRYIRQRYALGNTSHKKIANELGVCKRTVGDVLRGTFWKHVK